MAIAAHRTEPRTQIDTPSPTPRRAVSESSPFLPLLQDRTCALHEQFSQIGVTTLADTKQLLLAAGGVFARNQSHPGCELSPLVEGPSVADRRDEGAGRNWSDTRNRHEPSTGLVLMRGLLDHCVGLVNSHSQLIKIQLQLGQQHAHCAR